MFALNGPAGAGYLTPEALGVVNNPPVVDAKGFGGESAVAYIIPAHISTKKGYVNSAAKTVIEGAFARFYRPNRYMSSDDASMPANASGVRTRGSWSPAYPILCSYEMNTAVTSGGEPSGQLLKGHINTSARMAGSGEFTAGVQFMSATGCKSPPCATAKSHADDDASGLNKYVLNVNSNDEFLYNTTVELLAANMSPAFQYALSGGNAIVYGYASGSSGCLDPVFIPSDLWTLGGKIGVRADGVVSESPAPEMPTENGKVPGTDSKVPVGLALIAEDGSTDGLSAITMGQLAKYGKAPMRKCQGSVSDGNGGTVAIRNSMPEERIYQNTSYSLGGFSDVFTKCDKDTDVMSFENESGARWEYTKDFVVRFPTLADGATVGISKPQRVPLRQCYVCEDQTADICDVVNTMAKWGCNYGGTCTGVDCLATCVGKASSIAGDWKIDRLIQTYHDPRRYVGITSPLAVGSGTRGASDSTGECVAESNANFHVDCHRVPKYISSNAFFEECIQRQRRDSDGVFYYSQNTMLTDEIHIRRAVGDFANMKDDWCYAMDLGTEDVELPRGLYAVATHVANGAGRMGLLSIDGSKEIKVKAASGSEGTNVERFNLFKPILEYTVAQDVGFGGKMTACASACFKGGGTNCSADCMSSVAYGLNGSVKLFMLKQDPAKTCQHVSNQFRGSIVPSPFKGRQSCVDKCIVDCNASSACNTSLPGYKSSVCDACKGGCSSNC